MKNGPYEMTVAPEGYPGMRYRDRYAYEHHVVYWRATGLTPKPGLVIHHKNHNKRDNRIDNLAMITAVQHAVEHGLDRANPVVIKCSRCRTEFVMRVSDYKTKAKQSKTGRMFCSRKCQHLRDSPIVG